MAYQGAGRSLGVDEVAQLQGWAVGGLTPDLTVVVDVDPVEGRRRRGGTHDRMESEADAFHTAVREHFLALAESAPEHYLVVDGTAPPEQIHAAILDGLELRGVLR